MDARQILRLLRWKEAAEGEMTEHVRHARLSRRSNALAIVVGAQLLAVRHQLIAAQTQLRQQFHMPLAADSLHG